MAGSFPPHLLRCSTEDPIEDVKNLHRVYWFSDLVEQRGFLLQKAIQAPCAIQLGEKN